MLHEQSPLGGSILGLLCIQHVPPSRPYALACSGASGASEPWDMCVTPSACYRLFMQPEAAQSP